MTNRQSPKSPRASGKPAVPHPVPQWLGWTHRPWGSYCWGGGLADPPACLAAAPPSRAGQLPPLCSSLSLSTPPPLVLFLLLNSGFPLSLPLSWQRARESWGLGLKIRTGFLLSHGFPKDRSPHSTLGAFPTPRNTLRGKTDNDYVFLCASSVSPA